MNRFKALSGILAASVVAVLATAVQAAPIVAPFGSYEVLGDSGTLEVTTVSPTLQVTIAPLGSVYGAPVVTSVTANQYALTFTPSAAFFAAANNAGGTEKSRMAGKLDVQITLDNPQALTTEIKENGLFNTTGNGTVSVFGGAVVQSGDNNALTDETVSNGGLGAATTYGAGVWSADLVVGTFANNHNSYRITVDNDLFAQAIADQVVSSANISKKSFTIIITTTEGGGNIPEPASLGVLALGGLGLLARRRRA